VSISRQPDFLAPVQDALFAHADDEKAVMSLAIIVASPLEMLLRCVAAIGVNR
jgi:hypothetical protein